MANQEIAHLGQVVDCVSVWMTFIAMFLLPGNFNANIVALHLTCLLAEAVYSTWLRGYVAVAENRSQKRHDEWIAPSPWPVAPWKGLTSHGCMDDCVRVMKEKDEGKKKGEKKKSSTPSPLNLGRSYLGSFEVLWTSPLCPFFLLTVCAICRRTKRLIDKKRGRPVTSDEDKPAWPWAHPDVKELEKENKRLTAENEAERRRTNEAWALVGSERLARQQTEAARVALVAEVQRLQLENTALRAQIPTTVASNNGPASADNIESHDTEETLGVVEDSA